MLVFLGGHKVEIAGRAKTISKFCSSGKGESGFIFFGFCEYGMDLENHWEG